MTDVTGMESSGRVIPLYKGDYSNSTTYEIYDVVLYNNSSYIAKQTTTGHTPPSKTQNSNAYWQLIAKGIIDADVSDATVEFTQATTRTNLQSGETGTTLFGKIKKWFADLKPIAFSGTVADVSGALATSKVLTTKEQINANTDTSNVAGATAVKAMVGEINSNLAGLKFYALQIGTMPNAEGGTIHVDLPEGYTFFNTFVVCARILRSGTPTVYTNDGLMCHMYILSTGKIELIATADGVTHCAGQPISCVLCKLS